MTPDPCFDRSPQQRRCWVPIALRAPAPVNQNVGSTANPPSDVSYVYQRTEKVLLTAHNCVCGFIRRTNANRGRHELFSSIGNSGYGARLERL